MEKQTTTKKQAIPKKPDSAQKRLQRFEANEHKEIGNQALRKYFNANPQVKNELSDRINPTTMMIVLNDKVQLTAGEWIALAGDFYADPAKPISGLPHEAVTFDESKIRFFAAYSSLADINTSEQMTELEELRQEISKEVNVVKETVKNGGVIPKALHEHAAKSNSKYAQITATNIFTKFLALHLPLAVVGLTVYTRYLEIAVNNYDHFGKDAEIAYEAGHAVACKTAQDAHQQLQAGKKEEAINLLIKAITQELFACHFLTDLFAAGHMRVPRKELCRQVGDARLAGALSLMMHNEDNDKGLIVHQRNATEKTWRSKGDGCLYDEDAEENHQKAIDTVAAALQCIYDTYKDPDKARAFDYKEHIPIYAPAMNHAPLFLVDDEKKVVCRQSLEMTSDSKEEVKHSKDPENEPAQKPVENCQQEYSKEWSSVSTLIRLWFINKHSQPEDITHVTGEKLHQQISNELCGTDFEDTQEKQKSKSCVIL